MRHKGATRDDLRRLAMWLTIEQPELRTVIREAIDTVQAMSGAEFWKEARASAECHEETPFGMRVEGEEVTKVLTGAIDLVYRTGDSWHLLDYKTTLRPRTRILARNTDPRLTRTKKPGAELLKRK